MVKISDYIIPVLIFAIVVYGIYKKAPVYDLFVKGAYEGLKTAAQIAPFILAVFAGMKALTSSGAMELIEKAFTPAADFFSVPEELLPLIILRPVSGSGSLAVAGSIMESAGADSHIGRSAAVMVGSCETIFYVLALYFGVTSVKYLRHAALAGIAGYIVSVLASIYICAVI